MAATAGPNIAVPPGPCICEGLHRTLTQQFFRVALGKMVYGSLQEPQEDLDA